MVRDWDSQIQASRPHHQCHRPARHLKRPIPRTDPECVCPRRNRSERCGGIAKAIAVDAARLWRVWLVRCDVHIYAIGHRAGVNVPTDDRDCADSVETAVVCHSRCGELVVVAVPRPTGVCRSRRRGTPAGNAGRANGEVGAIRTTSPKSKWATELRSTTRRHYERTAGMGRLSRAKAHSDSQGL